MLFQSRHPYFAAFEHHAELTESE